MSNEFQLFVKEKQDRLSAQLIILIIASFSLSIQFSTNYGFALYGLLYVSWILYLVSAGSGIWKHGLSLSIDKTNLAELEASENLSRYRNIDLSSVEVITTQGKPAMGSVKEIVGKLEKKIEAAGKEYDKLNGYHNIVFKTEVAAFVLALLVNLVFISINLHIKANS